ncbi:Signal transducer regulating beta-lactamase production, contains metallopeptidase domain [Lysobacter sp. yr284]|uniref:M56 family metallopeptidase n=1 Tax=Lysobacter sp. yr284 TaxID=1761791 RepID=UPI00089B35FA|nr:M56 family metallopeptidase [Lysobacter sp. yr284]SDY19048.1 Signal transducer regulating beta-lactamase production, contains metallopeptidase domain [Lysobacter sp. yr284]
METLSESLIRAVPALIGLHLLQAAALLALAVGFARLRALDAESRSWLLLALFALATLAPLASLLPGAPSPVFGAPAHGFSPHPEEGPAPNEAIYNAGQRSDMLYLEIPRSLPGVLALAWALGALWQLMRLVEGARHARRLRRGARPAPALEALLARELPPRTRIATTAVDGPMVIGLLHPTVLLPRPLSERLDDAALRDILRHEFAHIRRGDLWSATAVQLARAAFWWNPFLAALQSRLDLAREMACDARAASCGSGVYFAGSLIDSAEVMLELGERPEPLAVAMLQRRSHLAQRIDGLLAAFPAGAPRGRRIAASACVAALAAFAGLCVAGVPRLPLPAPTAEPRAEVVALLAAARRGDSVEVRRLVRAGADIDARVIGDGTALIEAVRARNLATVDALLALGADPDRAALGEGNPLIVAAEIGAQPIVARLVQAGADVDRVVTYDETPLINAAREGHLATVQYLVAQGANVNLGVVADGWLGRWRSPLNQATDPQVRAYLIEHGAVAGRP